MKPLSIIALTWLGALLAMPAAANDQQLYDPAPPADGAFVRVLNAQSGSEQTASIGDAKYTKLAYPAISPYQVVKQGAQTFKAGNIRPSLTIEAGKYYTIAVTQQGSVVTLKDAIIENPSKAYVYFYNFSDIPKASLHATKQNVDIIANVSPQNGQHREMNALTVDMAITHEGKTVQAFPAVELKRRAGVSFVLVGQADAAKAIMAKNDIKR
ncbi:MAG: alginate O-acetyltransferase AlgF [Rickettsiales bacterium]|nr:alginate O-acetyltransferase AlgF [Rickettsiales bacterium]